MKFLEKLLNTVVQSNLAMNMVAESGHLKNLMSVLINAQIYQRKLHSALNRQNQWKWTYVSTPKITNLRNSQCQNQKMNPMTPPMNPQKIPPTNSHKLAKWIPHEANQATKVIKVLHSKNPTKAAEISQKSTFVVTDKGLV